MQSRSLEGNKPENRKHHSAPVARGQVQGDERNDSLPAPRRGCSVHFWLPTHALISFLSWVEQCPPNSYVEVLTPSTDHNLIFEIGSAYEIIKLKWGYYVECQSRMMTVCMKMGDLAMGVRGDRLGVQENTMWKWRQRLRRCFCKVRNAQDCRQLPEAKKEP